MTKVPRPRATAVPENAMRAAEIDAHLRTATLCRLSTLRSDGGIHLTPMWFLWDGERIHLSLHETRLHLKNLRRDPTATVLVDEDHRPGAGFHEPEIFFKWYNFCGLVAVK